MEYLNAVVVFLFFKFNSGGFCLVYGCVVGLTCMCFMLCKLTFLIVFVLLKFNK